MLIKAIILLSGSFFGSPEMDGILLNGYLNGVVSIAPPEIYEEAIRLEQIKLFSQNCKDVNLDNFIAALYGNIDRPVFKCGVALSGFYKKAWILSFYFTGMMSGHR